MITILDLAQISTPVTPGTMITFSPTFTVPAAGDYTFFFAASAYLPDYPGYSAPGEISVTCYIDYNPNNPTMVAGEASIVCNSLNMHTCLVSGAATVLFLEEGSHTVTLQAGQFTQFDGFDFFTLWCTETAL